MRLFIYLELFSQSTDASILSLLDFPSVSAFLPATSVAKAKMRSQAKTHSLRMRTVSALEGYLTECHFNEVSTEFLITESSEQLRSDIIVQSATQVLSVSPTNDLWDPTSNWKPEKTPMWSREFHTLAAREDRIRVHKVASYPSVLTTILELRTPLSVQLLNDWVYERLSREKVTGCREIIGGGGIEVFDEAARSFIVNVSRAENVSRNDAHVLSRLGRSFGTLQPIMVGEIGLCEQLALILNKEFHDAVQISKLGNDKYMGILKIPEEILYLPEAQMVALPFLSQQ